MSGICTQLSEDISAQNVVSSWSTQPGWGDGTEENAVRGRDPGSTEAALRASGDAAITVSVSARNEIWVKLAKCCTPVPGDDIVSFITRGQGVSVHHNVCERRAPGAAAARGDSSTRPGTGLGAPFACRLRVRALDRGGLLSDLTRVLSDYRVSILAAALKTGDPRFRLETSRSN